ncbi:MAG: hypothetical protein J6N45_03125 [Alphaproteobacteria bacterium]|nr:hypothetical protein [Alphaproteobacteria bacterium]
MEIYVFTALILVYVVTAFLVDKIIVRRIWTLAFIGASILTGISLACLRFYHQEVLLDAGNINWYYMIYLFGSVAAIIGLINLWIYRKPLWQIMRPQPQNHESVNLPKE